MNDSLQDVISAAVEGRVAKGVSLEGASRRATQLRTVETMAARKEDVTGPMPLQAGPATSAVFAEDGQPLGWNGLRLAFWLCGFHETLSDRVRRGEVLSEREDSLLALSRKDFAMIRPTVISMALERLQSVVAAAGTDRGTGHGRGLAMEVFALETLSLLSARASDLLRDAGPDQALSLFGDGGSVQEPLAIFQLIFSTALGLVESFIRLVPGAAADLSRLADILGSEIERI